MFCGESTKHPGPAVTPLLAVVTGTHFEASRVVPSKSSENVHCQLTKRFFFTFGPQSGAVVALARLLAPAGPPPSAPPSRLANPTRAATASVAPFRTMREVTDLACRPGAEGPSGPSNGPVPSRSGNIGRTASDGNTERHHLRRVGIQVPESHRLVGFSVGRELSQPLPAPPGDVLDLAERAPQVGLAAAEILGDVVQAPEQGGELLALGGGGAVVHVDDLAALGERHPEAPAAQDQPQPGPVAGRVDPVGPLATRGDQPLGLVVA